MCTSSCNHYTPTKNCNENENDLHSNQPSNLGLHGLVRMIIQFYILRSVSYCHLLLCRSQDQLLVCDLSPVLYILYRVVVWDIFYFHPYLGKIPILTNIFQMGWNHRLEYTFHTLTWFDGLTRLGPHGSSPLFCSRCHCFIASLPVTSRSSITLALRHLTWQKVQ